MAFKLSKIIYLGSAKPGTGSGGDQHNLGWYATQSALETAYPTATAGDWAIVGSTDTVWIWDTDTSAWVDSDQKGQVTSVNGQTGDVVLDLLPSQTGQSGKFLTTDGTDASWSDKPLVNVATNAYSLIIGGPDTSNGQATGCGIGAFCGWAGTAIGTNARAIGNGSSGSVAVGNNARATDLANSNLKYATAIGSTATAENNCAMALGGGAKATGTGSIQINASETTNTNSDANTFKVANANGNYEIMSADGTVPTARLTKVNTTITLTSAGWSSNTQTVNVTGMTATGVVFPCPIPADQADYTSAGIICSAQAAGTLTFTCDTVPSGDIDVTVVMM